jgi:hypothetical protein
MRGIDALKSRGDGNEKANLDRQHACTACNRRIGRSAGANQELRHALCGQYRVHDLLLRPGAASAALHVLTPARRSPANNNRGTALSV